MLAVLRDVEAQPQWVPQVTAAELLEEYEDGTPATASFELSTPIGTDQFTLEFDNADDGLSWTLVSSSMQKAQDGAYRLRRTDDGSTEVTFDADRRAQPVGSRASCGARCSAAGWTARCAG